MVEIIKHDLRKKKPSDEENAASEDESQKEERSQDKKQSAPERTEGARRDFLKRDLRRKPKSTSPEPEEEKKPESESPEEMRSSRRSTPAAKQRSQVRRDREEFTESEKPREEKETVDSPPTPAPKDKEPESGTAQKEKETTSGTARKPSRRAPAKKSTAKKTPEKKTTSRKKTATPKRTVSSKASSDKTEKVTNPVIGITGSYMPTPRDPRHEWVYFYTFEPYIAAIHKAGGVPIIIPVGLDGRYVNRVFEHLDGLLLTGGGDIDPNYYGDLLSPKLTQVEPRKDRTEIDLFNLAFNKNIPVFGVCRGAQLINVALDGSLFQHILDQVRMASEHHPDFPYEEPTHTVYIEEDSKLYRAVGEKEIKTNSLHHQGIKLIGKGLSVTARASDGIVEAIEHPSKKWVVGVQWHPELMWQEDKLQAKLFKEFVDMCKD